MNSTLLPQLLTVAVWAPLSKAPAIAQILAQEERCPQPEVKKAIYGRKAK
jgi:hypothetical protein